MKYLGAAVTVIMIASLSIPGEAQTAIHAGIRFSAPATVRARAYHLTDPGSGAVLVGGHGYSLNLHAVTLVGPCSASGVGIRITDAQNVIVRGVRVSGYSWGIVLERCSNVTLVDCTSSRNADYAPGTEIDESGHEPEDQHGGGIVLRDCVNCTVRRCTAQHQWDGIDVVRSSGSMIEQGDFSYNNNWGIHLWSSSKNTFRDNRATWCTTGEGLLYQGVAGWQTYDAQAVGIDHASCDNVIENNDLRFSGDGIFIRANEGGVTPGTPVPPLHSSDRNVLRGNDCSFSPNNAIEVDFVADTVIEDNNCSNSHYGMWLGYSRGSKVTRNTCVNDSTRGIEIENGQNGVISNNVLGFDSNSTANPLVYLRQNGRDNTPSGPYSINHNLFYGAAKAVLLRDTTADIGNNSILWTGVAPAKMVVSETPSRVSETRTRFESGRTQPLAPGFSVPGTILAGSVGTVAGGAPGQLPTVLELNGVPVWVRGTTSSGTLFWMPNDFWDRPAPENCSIRELTATGWSQSLPTKIVWPPAAMRVTSVQPNPAHLGDSIVVHGVNLAANVLLNGKHVEAPYSNTNQITFSVPSGVLVSSRYNIVVRSTKAPDTFTWPVTLTVDVPGQQQPHLVNASFSPTTLHVGETLTVRMTVHNNLPVAAALMRTPTFGATYKESQSFGDLGVMEVPGTLHLRVTSDHPGLHEPGSWPWLFGFNQNTLGPGETRTVEGYIRVETAGVHEFRVGLVATRLRFIDDNAFRTQITVLP